MEKGLKTLILDFTQQVFLNMSNDEKFVFILKFKWKCVCIYLEKAQDQRTEILYK